MLTALSAHAQYSPHESTRYLSVGSTGGSGHVVDLSGIDFRVEAITFKATTAGIIASLALTLWLIVEHLKSPLFNFCKKLPIIQ